MKVPPGSGWTVRAEANSKVRRGPFVSELTESMTLSAGRVERVLTRFGDARRHERPAISFDGFTQSGDGIHRHESAAIVSAADQLTVEKPEVVAMPTQGSCCEPLIEQVEQELRQGLDDLLARSVVCRFELPCRRPVIQTRAAEARRMAREGYEPVLKKTRWCILKRPEQPHRQAANDSARTPSLQPAERAGPPARGGVPAVLGIRVTSLGGQVPR